MIPLVSCVTEPVLQATSKERNPKKYIQDVITFLWREAIAADEVLKVSVPISYRTHFESLNSVCCNKKAEANSTYVDCLTV
jgi:hypothetical protein